MEEEKEIDSKEVSDALHMLLHCSLKDTEYETQKEQFEIVNAYIKQLEEENNQLKLRIKDVYVSRGEYEKAKTIMTKALKEYIPKSKIEEQIKWLDNDIKNTKHKLEEGKRPYPNYIGEYRRLRMKAFNTKSREIKERLQKLLEEE